MAEELFWNNLSKKIEKEYFIAGDLSEYESAIIAKLSHLNELRILDCGIGGGRVSRFLVKKAAYIVGFDLSTSMLNLAKKMVPGISLIKMKTESLAIKKEQFDVIIGTYILHHTDLYFAVPEIARVLKKEGIAIFVENFTFNPLLNFARKHLVGKFGITRKGTTEEHPLNILDFKIIKKYFENVRIETDTVFFARLLARTFNYKSKMLNYVTALFDRWLCKGIRSFRYYSYTQVLILRK